MIYTLIGTHLLVVEIGKIFHTVFRHEIDIAILINDQQDLVGLIKFYTGDGRAVQSGQFAVKLHAAIAFIDRE